MSKSFPLRDDEVLSLSDAEIISAIKDAPDAPDSHLRRISESFLVKSTMDFIPRESRNMEFVKSKTSIRVPKVVRVILRSKNNPPARSFTIMEYIPGTVLSKVWDSLSTSRREVIIDKVVDIVEELRGLRMDHVGPVGGGISEGDWFSIIDAGPFTVLQDLEDWFSNKINVLKRFKYVDDDTPSFSGMFTHAVMCHMDVATRNLILDDEDNLWLVDWHLSGAYHPCFEEAALKLQNDCLGFSEMLLNRIEKYEEHTKLMMKAHGAISSFPLHGVSEAALKARGCL